MRHLLTILIACLPATLWAAEDFHKAKTPTEKTLERMLTRANSDMDQLDNLFNGRGNPEFKPTLDYTELLTPGLMATLKAYEYELVKQNCDGKYGYGICGIDFSPIGCGQDFPEHYIYRTVSETEKEAVIERHWPEPIGDPVIYTLLKDGKHWRIDAIECETIGFESDRK